MGWPEEREKNSIERERGILLVGGGRDYYVQYIMMYTMSS